jgi:aspartyl-tRNA(Asn)/glutamyl-tRNA(Gln) amidotransferase subunit A
MSTSASTSSSSSALLPASASSRDRLEDALARIADPAGEGARTCLTVYADAARAAADAADARAKSGSRLGPLDGVVVTIKDLFDVAGEVTRAGSAMLAKRNAPATADAAIVARLRAAGAVIAAKTNMVEFAFSGVGLNPHFGTPGNPADRTRVPGGSSSGAGVAVADGIGAIAIGTDTGGSVRIPAGLCGLVGFKPTARRVPKDGTFPLSFTLDSIGPLARSVAECAATDAVMAGSKPADIAAVALGDIRMGVVQGLPLQQVDGIVGPAFAQALTRLKAARQRDVTLDALDIMNGVAARGGIAPPEAYAIHRKLLAEDGDGVDPFVRARINRAADIATPDYIEMLEDRRRGIARLDAMFNDLDVLVLPTTPIVAPTMAEVSTPDGFAPRNALLLRNTSIGNFFDLCGVSLPLRLGNALPVGLMLLGRHGDDARLLAIAAAVERQLAA